MRKSRHLKAFEESLDLEQLGAYLGFPKCCVDEFKAYMKACRSGLNPEPRPRRKLHGTGYIPCAKCNEEPKAVLEHTIQMNRVCSKPFPNWDFEIKIKKENPKP